MSDIPFFAVREDLIELLAIVEASNSLQYTLMGNFVRSEIGDRIVVYSTCADIPDFGRASADTSIACKSYLVCSADTPINLRRAGKEGERLCVDQLANPDSVEFKPGGIWNEEMVIQGRVASVSSSRPSRNLMKLFLSTIRRSFSKVGSCYVGPKALALLKAGKRLTSAAHLPTVNDLALQSPSKPMSSARRTRLSSSDSYELVRKLYPDAVPEPESPPKHSRHPHVGDNKTGIEFFRAVVNRHSLDNLTIPGSRFCRSEVGPISFHNTNLSGSVLCWNDFSQVNFTDTDLSACDLRASLFRETSFIRANLRNADLRHSSFTECDFTDADLRGAKLTRKQGEQIHLSEQQESEVDWQESDGDKPPGG